MKLGDTIHTHGQLHLGREIPPGTEGKLIGRKSGDYGTLWLVLIDGKIEHLASAEIEEAHESA